MNLYFYRNSRQLSPNLFTKTRIPLFFLLAVAACSNPGSKPKKDKATTSTNHDTVSYRKPPSGIDDTLVVKGKAAVFFSPDSGQLRKIKEITDTRIYESDTHDCFYQMRNARLVIKKYWPGLRIVETSKARWLLFVKADKSESFIDLDSKGAMCGVLLFDARKDPELVDMTNIETALRFYFEK